MARCVVASGNGKWLASFSVRGECAVGELAHRHVEHDVAAVRARDGEDEGVVADARRSRAPGGDIGKSIGPADSEDALFGSLPAEGSAAHPVVTIRESDSANTVRAGKLNSTLHGGAGIEITDSAVAIPTLDAAEGGGQCGDGVDVDAAVFDHRPKAREAIEAVRVDAIAGRFGEELRAESEHDQARGRDEASPLPERYEVLRREREA